MVSMGQVVMRLFDMVSEDLPFAEGEVTGGSITVGGFSFDLKPIIDELEAENDESDGDYDDSNDEIGYNPYMGCYDYDC